MTQCYRPECDNDLNTGIKYCSNRCSALDRKRVKAELAELTTIPAAMVTRLEKAIGANQASIVLSEVNKYLQDELISIPLPLTGQTYGDLVLSWDGKEDYRPGTQLSFPIIDKMLRSGPVVFAMEMKRAGVFRVFSQGRYKVISPDTELAEVAEAALRLILPKMAQDFTWSAFAYGVSFQEEVWHWRTKYELGMSNNRNATAKFLVPQVPNSVNPETVHHIRRTDDGGFNGFAQERRFDMASSGIDPILVDKEQALVIPLNERFRNLWGESILKALYIDWLWYEIIFRTMARYMERMAIPTAIARAPSRATVTMSGSSAPVRALDLGLALAGSLSKANAVAIPSDVDENGNALWDIGYLTAEERAQPFLQVLEYLAQCMIRDALSADRSLSQSSGGVGSYSIGEVHAAASAVTSEMILLGFLHYLNMYFISEFSLYNRGVGGPPIWLRTQAIDTQERELMMQLIAVAGNSPASQEFFYLIDWRTLGETSNIPLLTEEQLQELKDKLNEEAEEKMKTQQEIMAKNAAPIPTGGASAFGKGNGKVQPKSPAANGAAATKAEDEDEQEKIALENIFTHQIPWMLGEFEAQILYDNGVIGEETVKLFRPGEFDEKLVRRDGGKFAKKNAVAMTDADKIDMLPDHLADTEAKKLLQDLLKARQGVTFATEQEAIDAIIGKMAELGITDLSKDIKIKFDDNLEGGGQYNPNDNTITINGDLSNDLLAGSPTAIHCVAHELLHARQDPDRELLPGESYTSGGRIIDEEPYSIAADNQSAMMQGWSEGTTDLVAAMVTSKMYGVPVVPRIAGLLDYATNPESILKNPEVLVWHKGVENAINHFGYPAETKFMSNIVSDYAKKEKISYGLAALEIQKNALDIKKIKSDMSYLYDDDPTNYSSIWDFEKKLRQAEMEAQKQQVLAALRAMQ